MLLVINEKSAISCSIPDTHKCYRNEALKYLSFINSRGYMSHELYLNWVNIHKTGWFSSIALSDIVFS